MDGDGTYEVVAGTRAGWFFAWKTPGKVGKSVLEWRSFGHDLHNTGNYETDAGSTADIAPSGDATTSPDTGPAPTDTGSVGTDTAASGGGGGGGCASQGPAPSQGLLGLLALALALLLQRKSRGIV